MHKTSHSDAKSKSKLLWLSSGKNVDTLGAEPAPSYEQTLWAPELISAVGRNWQPTQNLCIQRIHRAQR